MKQILLPSISYEIVQLTPFGFISYPTSLAISTECTVTFSTEEPLQIIKIGINFFKAHFNIYI